MTRPAGGKEPPMEVYQSQTPLDHHARRFYQIRGRAPNVVDYQNWVPMFPMLGTDQNQPSNNAVELEAKVQRLEGELVDVKQTLQTRQNDLEGAQILRDLAIQKVSQ